MRRRDETASRTEEETGQQPGSGTIGWLRRNLFQSWVSTLQTVVALVLLVWLAERAVSWLVLDAVWVVTDPDRPCRGPEGACWPLLTEHIRFFLIGWYPLDQLWRVCLALGFLLLCPFLIVRWIHWAWSWRWLATVLVATVFLFWILFGGAGLEPVKSSQLGGLLLNLWYAVLALAIGLPVGVAVALVRQSKLPAIRVVGFGFCAFFGGTPTIILIFVGSILMPLFLPESDPPIRLFPFSVVLFLAAIIATAVSRPIRAGLLQIPASQKTVAVSLGLRHWTIVHRVGVPQALIGQSSTLVAIAVWMLLETSVLVVIGQYGLYGILSFALTKPEWVGEMGTALIVTGSVYFSIGLAIRRYGKACEAARQDRTGGRGPLVLDPFPSP